MTDDQDLHDWKRDRNRKSLKKLEEQMRRQRRLEAEEVHRRYEEERQQRNDAQPFPRID